MIRSTRQSIPVTAAIVAALLTATQLPAQPAKPMSPQERCARYSEESLYQVRQARELGCAYGGPRWSADYDAHHSWCLGQDAETLRSEAEFRQQELTRCEAHRKSGDAQAAPPPTMAPLDEAEMMPGTLKITPPVSAEGRCEAYALTAVAQQGQNEQQRCGQAGPAWNADADLHRSWCSRQNQGTLDGETSARAAALQSCLGGREPAVGGDARCTAYAAAAVHQNFLQQGHGCGLSGPGWSGDFLYHYHWCLKQQGGQPEGETAERNRLLAGCGAAATPINVPGPVRQ